MSHRDGSSSLPSSSFCTSKSEQQQQQQHGTRAFDELALDVSGFGPISASTPRAYTEEERSRWRQSRRRRSSENCELWDDYGVVEYLERGLHSPDESTEDQRVEAMRDTLKDTDILEADGSLTDFLFHVARTKYGKIYVRVVRTLLLNRVNAFSVVVALCSKDDSEKIPADVVSWSELLLSSRWISESPRAGWMRI
ncbi:uncharacterized protein LOC131671136 [Phymastichus coffea]|uniref:uncharacterized protein LOC131671136 n=1 Tax=Phymastichus coffea TaxID=108790 RepID=UPI00273C3E0D|nr:uncharacterized protein LOC131671136 [Phymastichus coffea]